VPVEAVPIDVAGLKMGKIHFWMTRTISWVATACVSGTRVVSKETADEVDEGPIESDVLGCY
jgi:hypothetical protein